MEKMSKKLINLPENCVDEMLDGLVKAHPGLCLHANYRVILTKQVSDCMIDNIISSHALLKVLLAFILVIQKQAFLESNTNWSNQTHWN